MKPRMGRKKSNARILPRGRKIHVNKYINKRGCTKHKSAATHNHSTEKQQESSRDIEIFMLLLPCVWVFPR